MRENLEFGVLNAAGGEEQMELLYPRCGGLDVHKKSITACVLLVEGKKRHKVLRRFGTMTAELRELAAWLASFSVCSD